MPRPRGRPRGIPKTGGRKVGSINKTTAAVRARILSQEALTADATIEAIRRGQHYDIRQLYKPDGTLKELHELTEAEAWPIIGIEILRVPSKDKDAPADTVVKYRLEGRRGYVELAARHQGLLNNDKSGGVNDLARVIEEAFCRTPRSP